ncbi:MAG: hypothetical protein H0W61_09135 [Bacteroidetes bacterium]|nr:hypothetical protein [Bacteroidota bacterium]
MKQPKKHLQDFRIDKLTNSIENVISGDSFRTEVLPLSSKELKSVRLKDGWNFKWADEFKQTNGTVYKLVIRDNINIIQWLISLTPTNENVFINLIESAPFNIGKGKVYAGVSGNLVAFACNQSFIRGTEGYVSFLSKTKLIPHYQESLGAQHVGGHLMVINTNAALRLIDKYFDK